jgi:uncharacterized membrane protein (UPF0127 family)
MSIRLCALAVLLVPLWAGAAPTRMVHITTDHGKTIPLALEVADTAKKRAIGLSKRKTIAPSDGMLFLFEKPIVQKFWMKDTWIPLDILFVDADHRIVFIARGVPMSEEALGPDIPITSVIEIDAGRAAKNGISVGHHVQVMPIRSHSAAAH